jgi:hypothetical protein
MLFYTWNFFFIKLFYRVYIFFFYSFNEITHVMFAFNFRNANDFELVQWQNQDLEFKGKKEKEKKSNSFTK